MIDSERFWPEWLRLCKRFNRPPDENEAADYLEYLDASGQTTEQAIAAARAQWAVREFFPRPADFLAGEAAVGWTAIRDFADRWTAHLSSDDARALIGAIPPRAKQALEALGGIDAVRKAKDVPWLRKDYFEAFERVVVEEVVRPSLRPATPALMLESGEALVHIDPTPGRLNVQLLKQLAGVTESEPAAQPA